MNKAEVEAKVRAKGIWDSYSSLSEQAKDMVCVILGLSEKEQDVVLAYMEKLKK